jgi:hypothetical protein
MRQSMFGRRMPDKFIVPRPFPHGLIFIVILLLILILFRRIKITMTIEIKIKTPSGELPRLTSF